MSLPDMSLPFPATCHPAVDEIERATLAWASEYVDTRTLRHLEKTRAGRIAARTAALTAPVGLLHAYGRMLAWGFWFDDAFVDDLAADSPLHIDAITSILDILDGECGTGSAGHAMESAFAEVIGGLRDVLSPAQLARWSSEMRLWFTSMTLQNQMRASSAIPSVQAYKTMRLYTVCSFACIVLIDASHGDHVGWDDYHNPHLTALRRQAANVTAWQNDVFSFFAEQKHPGQFWNLPSVYAAHGRSRSEALQSTAQDAADEVNSFRRGVALLGPSPPRAEEGHVHSLTAWMRGCHDWSLEAAERYVGWADPADAPLRQGVSER